MTNRKKKTSAAPELYFVIGGGINRTKCGTPEDALAHAKVLLDQRNEVAGKVVLGVDMASGSDQTVIHVMEHGANKYYPKMLFAGRSVGKTLSLTDYARYLNWGDEVTIPKIERKQCVKNTAPLYIVKVVAVVEQEAPRVKVRQPKGDELPQA